MKLTILSELSYKVRVQNVSQLKLQSRKLLNSVGNSREEPNRRAKTHLILNPSGEAESHQVTLNRAVEPGDSDPPATQTRLSPGDNCRRFEL